MTARLYSVNVPARSNAGRRLTKQRARFLASVARIAGGYTYHPASASGAWRDPATGRTYLERMGALDFIGHRGQVLRAWHEAFPDQIAAMITGPIPAHIVTMKG
jgi:hypothetical protein